MAFSVVIPVHNGERTVERAVQSALASGADCVIVVDDGSDDASGAVAARSGGKVIRQENAGAANARRRGLSHVETPFVVMLDADDVLLRSGIAIGISLLSSCPPDVSAVVGRSMDFSETGDGVPSRQWREGITVRSLYGRGHSPAPPAAVLWRTSQLRRVYSDEPPALWPRYAEDYELLLRASLIGEIRTIDALMCRYSRVGGKSALHPERSIASAQAIREHYAPLTSGRWGRLSRARSISLRARKASSLFSGPLLAPVRVILLLFAGVMDPYYGRTLLNVFDPLSLNRKSAS